MLDVGLVEEPPGSNRSPTIDGYMRAVGSPVGLPWCAAGVAAWWRESGAQVPLTAAGAVSTWWDWSLAMGLRATEPQPGYAVLYALADGHTPDHMGILARVTPLRTTVEANTTLKRQSGSERNGIACELAVQAENVVGYIRPEGAP